MAELTPEQLEIAKLKETVEKLSGKMDEYKGQVDKLQADNSKLENALDKVKNLIPVDKGGEEEGCTINTFDIEMKAKGDKSVTVSFEVVESHRKANKIYIPGVGFAPLEATIKQFQNKENENLLTAIKSFEEHGYEFAPIKKAK